jgi:hypothetical protein
MSAPPVARPEDRARTNIDHLLTAAGWLIQNRNSINIEAGRGIAIREFVLTRGHGFADYLLYIDGYAAGVVEAKKAGLPLIGVEIETAKYREGLPDNLPAPRRPLPFCYQSTGIETRFTNLLDPDARSRPVFGFHRPETLIGWLESDLKSAGSGVRNRLRVMPPVPRDGLWDHQHRVIVNLEQSLARNDPRALIHMTMGSGKTRTACNFIYRLIAHAGARRVVFLVDRRTLGRQALNEFQQFTVPGDGRKFTEIYNVQLLSSNTIDPASSVRPLAINWSDVRYLRKPLDEHARLRQGDLLFTRLNGSIEYVANCATVDDLGIKAIFFPDRLFRVRLREGIYPGYIALAFASKMMRRQVHELTRSSAGHQRISISDLKRFTLPVPSYAAQVQIAQEASRILSVLAALRGDVYDSSIRAVHLRQAILKKAFEGKLVPQDPNDEPASVLLERICAKREYTPARRGPSKREVLG